MDQIPRYIKHKIPEYRRLSGITELWFKLIDWEEAAPSTYGDWDSLKWEIWNGEGIEDAYAPLIEESGPVMFPGSPTRSTTYSLFKKEIIAHNKELSANMASWWSNLQNYHSKLYNVK